MSVWAEKMISKEERDERLKQLRGRTGGVCPVRCKVELDGDVLIFDVLVDVGTPYVSLTDPTVTKLIEARDERLAEILEAVCDQAFYRELVKREEECSRLSQILKKPQERKKEGYIYLLKAEDGRYKIGRTKSIDSRLKAISTASPQNIQLAFSLKVSDTFKAESYLHDRFKNKRGRGEWFELTREDVEWIRSLKDGYFDA